MTAHPQAPAGRRRGLGSRLALTLPLLALAGLLFTGSTANRPAAVPATHVAGTELQPSERHRKVARLVGEVIERSHYRQAVLDEKMSSQVFDRYIESLDPSRS